MCCSRCTLIINGENMKKSVILYFQSDFIFLAFIGFIEMIKNILFIIF